jgi:hypothetical protein
LLISDGIDADTSSTRSTTYHVSCSIKIYRNQPCYQAVTTLRNVNLHEIDFMSYNCCLMPIHEFKNILNVQILQARQPVGVTQVEAVGRTRCSIFLCSSRASICLLSCSGDFVAFHENEDLRGLKAHQHLVGESFHVCSSCQPMVSLCCSFFVLLDYLRGSGRSREQQQTNKPPHG